MRLFRELATSISPTARHTHLRPVQSEPCLVCVRATWTLEQASGDLLDCTVAALTHTQDQTTKPIVEAWEDMEDGEWMDG